MGNPGSPVNLATDLLEPYIDEPSYLAAKAQVAATCERRGISAGIQHAYDIVDAFEDVRAMRDVRMAERE